MSDEFFEKLERDDWRDYLDEQRPGFRELRQMQVHGRCLDDEYVPASGIYYGADRIAKASRADELRSVGLGKGEGTAGHARERTGALPRELGRGFEAPTSSSAGAGVAAPRKTGAALLKDPDTE